MDDKYTTKNIYGCMMYVYNSSADMMNHTLISELDTM